MFEDIMTSREKLATIFEEVSFAVLTPDAKSYLILITNETGPVVGILPDGTVEIYQEGKAKEAAEIFYDALGIVFKEYLNTDTKTVSEELISNEVE
jgi:hypothetical protein